jgi:hypothetical protein
MINLIDKRRRARHAQLAARTLPGLNRAIRSFAPQQGDHAPDKTVALDDPGLTLYGPGRTNREHDVSFAPRGQT